MKSFICMPHKQCEHILSTDETDLKLTEMILLTASGRLLFGRKSWMTSTSHTQSLLPGTLLWWMASFTRVCWTWYQRTSFIPLQEWPVDSVHRAATPRTVAELPLILSWRFHSGKTPNLSYYCSFKQLLNRSHEQSIWRKSQRYIKV